METAVLFMTVILVGLMSGLFYSWSVSVMRGLKDLPDREFIVAMQSMNRAILNPLFFVAFMGAGILLIVSCVQHFQKPLDLRYLLLLSSTFFYLTGVFGVTVTVNVPLNNRLDVFNLETPDFNEIKKIRTDFETRWNFFNNIRTICSILSFITIVAMLFISK